MPSAGSSRQAAARALEGAVAALRQGQWSQAERLCREALALDGSSFQAHYVLGVVLGQAGRSAEALACFDRAVGLDPRQADAHFNRGVAQASLGHEAGALESYGRAIALQPTHLGAHFNRGLTLAVLGRHAESLASHDRALELDPRAAEGHHARGLALVELGRLPEAIESFDRAIALRPGYAAAFGNRGAALARLGMPGEALESYDRALGLRPDAATVLVNRAIALLELDRPGEALEGCDRAIALAPELADAWYIRGNALRERGRHREAVTSYERAIALAPAHASAHWNLADCLLLQGDFPRGWREYEWRWRLPARADALTPEQPVWLGDQLIEGRTLLLHSELGLGDTLQFCRYATEAARLGARVLVEVQSPLVPLVRTLAGVAEVFARGEPRPAFDLHCPIMSLPLAFRTELATVPSAVPYLRSDPARIAAWKQRLGAPGRLRVGLAWSGSRALPNDKRSMDLRDALALLDPRAQWVSLQKDVPPADAALLASREDLAPHAARLSDFAETAALVDLMDLVITVDTSVAHVAGALGKPVWILLPLGQHDWRWQLEREDSPWYPTARLFRQARPGDWPELVLRVRSELAKWLSGAS